MEANGPDKISEKEMVPSRLPKHEHTHNHGTSQECCSETATLCWTQTRSNQNTFNQSFLLHMFSDHCTENNSHPSQRQWLKDRLRKIRRRNKIAFTFFFFLLPKQEIRQSWVLGSRLYAQIQSQPLFLCLCTCVRVCERDIACVCLN